MGEVPEHDPFNPPAPQGWQPPVPPGPAVPPLPPGQQPVPPLPPGPAGPQGWQPPNQPPVPPSYWQQPPPYGQAYQPPYPNAAPYSDRTNTLAIVSLVSAFFVSLAAIITGHIALGQIKRTGEQGRGMAIAGLIIGYVGAVGTALFVVLAIVLGLIGGFATTSGFVQQGGSTTVQNVGPVPENANSFGGITFGKNGAVVPPAPGPRTVDYSQLPPDPEGEPEKAFGLNSIGIQASATGQPVQVVVYLDFMCPYCAAFEKQVGPDLKKWQDEGKVTVEYRPLDYLNRASNGTYYSSRAAMAAACVANASPGKYTAFAESLFAHQPAENSDGLDDDTLAALAAAAGAADISDCLGTETYYPYSDYTSGLAFAHGVTGTPTVFMDGRQWLGGTFGEFSGPILAAKK